MTPPDLLEDVVVHGNYVSAADVKTAQKFAATHHVSLEEALLRLGTITNDLLGQALAEHFHIPYENLNSKPPGVHELELVPEEIAKAHRLVGIKKDDSGITIATDNPGDPMLPDLFLKTFPGTSITLHYALPRDIDAALRLYRKPLTTRFETILKDKAQIASRIIQEIVTEAISLQASDLHFEPQEKEVVVRFRVDGVLQEAGRIPIEHYGNILNRIKVQAHLRIDEHLVAQDGAIRYREQGELVDMRVSIVPTLDGEKAAIRLLGEYVGTFSMEELGLSKRDQEVIQAVSKKPFGMILASGPTGSGKTTVLYALLKLLNEPDVNITTIEDPVEYKMIGVNQIQVNQETNLTFANGLRSIVRQDPDIILVGEIRDSETAEIAVNAALTGHLLLSTFHANDAATTIPRLLEMGIEPFLLASTLELVIARRLIRKICEQCRYSVNVKRSALEEAISGMSKYFPDATNVLYAGKGCKVCNSTGYKGRTGIFELIPMSAAMRELTLTHPSSQTVWKLAVQEGAHSLFEDGIQKVKNGITTIQEVLRVAPPASNK